MICPSTLRFNHGVTAALYGDLAEYAPSARGILLILHQILLERVGREPISVDLAKVLGAAGQNEVRDVAQVRAV